MSTPHRPATQYIDGSAQDTDYDECLAFNDGKDSAEAEVHRQDAHDFDVPFILATHKLRLHASMPYRIPTALLQAGAATPLHREEINMGNLPPSCPVSPAFGFSALLTQTQISRAATPVYMPAPDALLPSPIHGVLHQLRIPSAHPAPTPTCAQEHLYSSLAHRVRLLTSMTSAPPHHSPEEHFPNVGRGRLLFRQLNKGA
ncbi:hypothetical protein C8R44DRAFT_731381 [Mycena epipterygia]|nr:hypothetical protein C8R44DRAFT_731381 [Mycena epipterygia]